MNKYLKIILAIFIVVLSLLLLSPIISLILPLKLTNHTYYRLLYHVIVDKETEDCFSDEEKALRLFQYVVDHEFAQGAPYKCKPAESLIYGEAYCDFQARTLNALLGIGGIKSRYAMLLDRENKDISPHTLNEIFLNEKWCVFDPLSNMIFQDKQGNKVSLQELSDNPNLMEFNVGSSFSRMFPIVYEPKRSTPCMFQTHIFDDILDIYFKIFKYNFFNFYQDLYLKFKQSHLIPEDSKLFFIARNYHLSYRRNLALKYYNILLKGYPQSNYVEDTIFFCGMLYFEMKDFAKSKEFLRLILNKYSQKWRNATNFYLEKIDTDFEKGEGI